MFQEPPSPVSYSLSIVTTDGHVPRRSLPIEGQTAYRSLGGWKRSNNAGTRTCFSAERMEAIGRMCVTSISRAKWETFHSPLVFFAKFSYPRWNLEEETSVIIDPHSTDKFANAGFLLIN